MGTLARPVFVNAIQCVERKTGKRAHPTDRIFFWDECLVTECSGGIRDVGSTGVKQSMPFNKVGIPVPFSNELP